LYFFRRLRTGQEEEEEEEEVENRRKKERRGVTPYDLHTCSLEQHRQVRCWAFWKDTNKWYLWSCKRTDPSIREWVAKWEPWQDFPDTKAGCVR